MVRFQRRGGSSDRRRHRCPPLQQSRSQIKVYLTQNPTNKRYYDLMIRLSLHKDDYLATAKHYLSVYHTSTIPQDSDRSRGVLQSVLIFVVLAPYDNEQSDLLARVVREDPVKNNQIGWVGGFV